MLTREIPTDGWELSETQYWVLLDPQAWNLSFPLKGPTVIKSQLHRLEGDPSGSTVPGWVLVNYLDDSETHLAWLLEMSLPDEDLSVDWTAWIAQRCDLPSYNWSKCAASMEARHRSRQSSTPTENLFVQPCPLMQAVETD